MTSEYRQQEFQHTPVLLAECLEQSNLKPQQTFVDATLGGAGHSLEMAKLIARGARSSASTRMRWALAAAAPGSSHCPTGNAPTWSYCAATSGIWTTFSSVPRYPGSSVLFDLGVSSVQIDTPSRGFSFKENGPLDMRMDPGKTT